MAALTGKERDQVPKSLLNVRLIIIPPRTVKREGERKTWQSMQETDERERVLEESLDGLSGQFRNLKTSVRERGLS